MRWLGLAALAWLAAGCATVVPDELAGPVSRRLSLAELRAQPGAYVGARVMLGGEVLVTTLQVGQTEVEVLGRVLRGDGSPERSDHSEGRFLLRTTQFLDPAVYAPGRRLTVIGAVTGDEERRIGDLPYHYPVVAAERIVLWPRYAVVPPPPPWPHYYDPFWDWPPYRYYPRAYRHPPDHRPRPRAAWPARR